MQRPPSHVLHDAPCVATEHREEADKLNVNNITIKMSDRSLIYKLSAMSVEL